MASVVAYKKEGKIYSIGGGSAPGNSAFSPLVMIDGKVHTYDSEVTDEPYLNEWGWKCCETELERELYRWLYKCMVEGLDVEERTVEVNGEEVTFITDCTQDGIDEIAKNMKDRMGNRGSAIYKLAMEDENLTFMRIPVEQFQIKESSYSETKKESILYTICQRIMMDNPLILFPFYPSENREPVAAIKNEDGYYRYIYSVVPTKEKRAQAIDICKEQIENIVKKVKETYCINPGDDLSVAAIEHGLSDALMRVRVLKVIHDCIVLHANMNGTEKGDWMPTPYAVFDTTYKGNCTSYTMAFCAVARLYGIEAINMTGIGWIDANADGKYELTDDHAWVAVRISGEPYGTYPEEASKWTCIYVYWDEPLHETKIHPEDATFYEKDIIWKYFMDLDELNFIPSSDNKSGRSCRIPDATISYGSFPFGESIPAFVCKYTGNKLYTWEE